MEIWMNKIIRSYSQQETLLRAEQPDKDRGCSFYHALEGILLITTEVSLDFTWLINILP